MSELTSEQVIDWLHGELLKREKKLVDCNPKTQLPEYSIKMPKTPLPEYSISNYENYHEHMMKENKILSGIKFIEVAQSPRRIVVECQVKGNTHIDFGKRYIAAWDTDFKAWEFKDNVGSDCCWCTGNDFGNVHYPYICEYHDGLDIQTVGREGDDVLAKCINAVDGFTVGRIYHVGWRRFDGKVNFFGDDGNQHAASHLDFQPIYPSQPDPAADRAVDAENDQVQPNLVLCDLCGSDVHAADLPSIDAQHPLLAGEWVECVSDRFICTGVVIPKKTSSKDIVFVDYGAGISCSQRATDLRRIPAAEGIRRWNEGVE